MSSTADTDEEIEVSADGLTVRKTFTADEFPVPAIRFEIESDRDEQVAFRLSEDIPESFPMDKVGFHPDYNSDDWTAFQDNHVEFTGELEAGGDLVTVYGIRIDDESEADRFLTEPDIVEVSTAGESDSDAAEVDDDVLGEIVSEDSNQAVKDVIAGESESVPGLEDDEDDPDDEDADPELDLDLDDVDPEPEPVEEEPDDDAPDIDLDFDEDSVGDGDEADGPEIELDLDEPDDAVEDESPSEAVAVAPPADDTDEHDVNDGDGEDHEADGVEDATETATDGSVVEQLLAELRDDGLAEDDRDLLRNELDLEPSGPDIAKVDHLQSRVEEVAAYTDALETFLEENGTGKQLIDELQTLMDDLEADLEAVETRVDDNEGRIETVADDLEAVGADVSAVEDDVSELGDDVDDLEEDVSELDDGLEAVEADVDDLEDGVEAVRADVTEIQEWRDELGSMFSN